jgi:hypothetical protein
MPGPGGDAWPAPAFAPKGVNMSNPLPVISLLNSLMTVNAYLQSATNTNLPPIITKNQQYATLVTDFTDWQENLWAQFWEGLSAGISAESTQVNSLFQDGVDEETIMNSIFYDGSAGIVVSQCTAVANLVAQGQGLLTQLNQIAASIQQADKTAVENLTKLVDQLQDQFAQQEDELTQDALDSATEVVSTAVDIALAIGSEGEDIEPLIKGVIKLGTSAINELTLTSEINQTLSELETEWAALDQATTDLTQITLTCNQLKAVADEASETLDKLQSLSDDWNSVAASTQQSADDWSAGGSMALQQWAAQMVKLAFGNATQLVSASAGS